MSLPYNWTLAPVLSLCTARMGPTILAKDLTTKGLPVFSAGGSGEPWGYTELPFERFGPHTIVLSARGSIGNPRLPGLCAFTSTQTTIAATCADEIAPRYLRYALQTLPWQEIASGAAIPMLTISRLGEQSVPLAPTEEQKRIADKLDTVLNRVDAVNTRLARVAPILKRFRQSVLAAATSGRLTEDWREPSGISDPSDSGLPSTWKVVTASDVCVSVRDGTHDTPFYVERGVPLVTSRNIGPKGIDFSGAKMISAQDHFEISKRSAVARGDVLISMIGTVGQVCLVDTDEVFSIKNVGLFKTAEALCMPRYFFYWLQSPQYTTWLQQNMRGGNQKFISLGLLRESLVHEPPLQEQAEIVRRVETLFAFADRLEARLQTAQTATERLTPALLAKAFRGELVPQDPNDEPASELLRRLQREAPSTSTRRGRKSAA